MMLAAILFVAALAFLLAAPALGRWTGKRRIERFRAQGVYPAEGCATMEDVRRLAASGYKLLAIRAYREIHKVGLAEAKRAVERLESETAS